MEMDTLEKTQNCVAQVIKKTPVN